MTLPTTLVLPRPTSQQSQIHKAKILQGESIKVDACAGTGKTTTFIQFAQLHPEAKMLYICFNNKSVSEAAEKFRAARIKNVTCSTVHGLARETKALYESLGKFRTRVHLKEIKAELDCSHQHAWKVYNLLQRFCNSADQEPNEQHCCHRKAGEDNPVDQERQVLQALRTGVLRSAKLIWDKTRSHESHFPISFDGYLKVYQIENHRLAYDYILVDESQDSNPLTISILQNNAAHTRIILIGDSQQALYSFRGAHNAMESWHTDTVFPLTESFRFGTNIAKVANLLLTHFQKCDKKTVSLKMGDSLGDIPKGLPYTLISRTNTKLYEAALQAVSLGKKVHFVGTNADNNWDPTIPYKFNDALDTYRIFIGKKADVRNPYFKNFENYDELQKIARGITTGENEEGTKIQGDKELEALCRLVEKYKEKLPATLEKIVSACAHPQDAAIELTTTHRSKGLEWKRVKMADDFTKLVVYDKEEDGKGGVKDGPPRLAVAGKDADPEEFNILYVAVTRASERLQLCPQILDLLDLPHLIPRDIEAIEISEDYTPTQDDIPQRETPPPNELKIPYDEKEIAKEIAQSEGGRLLWNATRKAWTWSHFKEEPVPAALKKYLKAA